MKIRLSRVRIPYILPLIHSTPPTSHKVGTCRAEELICAVAYMAVMSLLQLHFEYIDGNPIPKVIFHGRPSTFHAVLLGLLLSFSGAAMALLLDERHAKRARFCRRCAVLFMAVTLAVLIWVGIPAIFKWVISLVC